MLLIPVNIGNKKLSNMCLYFDKTIAPENGYIADKDITCYKVLAQEMTYRNGKWPDIMSSIWVSPMHSDYEWKINDEKKSYLNINTHCRIYNVRTHKWLGSDAIYKVTNTESDWLDPNRAIEPEMVLDPDLGCIKQGLYSFTTYGNDKVGWWTTILATSNITCGIFRAIIPKGSRYFVSNDCTTYVSDRLKLIELVEKIPTKCNNPEFFTL